MGEPYRVVLDDGTPLLIKPVGPEDGPCLQAGFARLSERARYQRFHQVRARLSAAEPRYLTHVDQVDHIALGAHALSGDGPRGAGLARCVRLPAEPEVAEVAVTVVDDYHGRGVAGQLLTALIHAARRKGILRFRAQVQSNNRAALALARRLGSEIAPAPSGLVGLSLELAARPQP